MKDWEQNIINIYLGGELTKSGIRRLESQFMPNLQGKTRGGLFRKDFFNYFKNPNYVSRHLNLGPHLDGLSSLLHMQGFNGNRLKTFRKYKKLIELLSSSEVREDFFYIVNNLASKNEYQLYISNPSNSQTYDILIKSIRDNLLELPKIKLDKQKFRGVSKLLSKNIVQEYDLYQ